MKPVALSIAGLRNFLGGGRPESVGIDTGKWSVKIARVGGATPPFDLKVLSSGKPSQDDGKEILHTVETLELTGAPGAFALPDGSTELVEFKLPLLPDDELKTAIDWEIKKAVASEEFVYHDVLTFPGTQGVDVQCVVASKDIVKAKFEEARKMGVAPHFLETESSALLSCAQALSPEKSLDRVAILDLGYQAFRLIFVHEGRVTFTRSIYFGLESIFNQAANALDIDVAACDVMFRSLGADEARYAADKDPHKAGFERIVQESLYSLCDELHRSELYTKEQKNLDGATDILLCGGGGAVPFVSNYLAGHLTDRKVAALDPFRGAVLPQGIDSGSGPTWALAVGLALRGAE